MKDFKVLQLLDKVQFIFRKMGIDYSIMRQILHIKLTMDERKVPTIFNQNKKIRRIATSNLYGFTPFMVLYSFLLWGLVITIIFK